MKDYSGIVFGEIVIFLALLVIVSNRFSLAWAALLGQAKVVGYTT